MSNVSPLAPLRGVPATVVGGGIVALVLGLVLLAGIHPSSASFTVIPG